MEFTIYDRKRGGFVSCSKHASQEENVSNIFSPKNVAHVHVPRSPSHFQWPTRDTVAREDTLSVIAKYVLYKVTTGSNKSKTLRKAQ